MYDAVYQTVTEVQVGHVVVDGGAVGYRPIQHVTSDHDPANTRVILPGFVSVGERGHLMGSPVVRTHCVCHRGVCVVSNQPVETRVGEEADALPFGTAHVVTARVEVAHQQDVLSGKCRGSVALCVWVVC